MIEPTHWQLFYSFLAVQGSAVVIVLFAVSLLARSKVNRETFNLFIKSTEVRFEGFLKTQTQLSVDQRGLLERIAKIEERNIRTDIQIGDIKNSINRIDNTLTNMDVSSVVLAIRNFRREIHGQVKSNQNLLLDDDIE